MANTTLARSKTKSVGKKLQTAPKAFKVAKMGSVQKPIKPKALVAKVSSVAKPAKPAKPAKMATAPKVVKGAKTNIKQVSQTAIKPQRVVLPERDARKRIRSTIGKMAKKMYGRTELTAKEITGLRKKYNERVITPATTAHKVILHELDTMSGARKIQKQPVNNNNQKSVNPRTGVTPHADKFKANTR